MNLPVIRVAEKVPANLYVSMAESEMLPSGAALPVMPNVATCPATSPHEGNITLVLRVVMVPETVFPAASRFKSMSHSTGHALGSGSAAILPAHCPVTADGGAGMRTGLSMLGSVAFNCVFPNSPDDCTGGWGKNEAPLQLEHLALRDA